LDALEPRSRAPRTNPTRTSGEICERVIELRVQLTADGLDAGPVTIAWHLQREGLRAPAPATISRILTRAGLVSPQPRKRPRSSFIRFQAAQPNEMWQSDFIHWRLADGTDVEILNWLDDHSRYLLSCTAHQPVTGDAVVSVFLATVAEHGPPASTLTDNGSVYTSRFTGGRNAFEYVLPLLGIKQKNGSPGHPQTQGKTERFHQTQQRWLRARPPAPSITQLQRQLDEFRAHYNEKRPHRALDRRTPANAYQATPKALPANNGHPPGHYRLRYDRLDNNGKMSLRRAGRMHHLGVGAKHARKRESSHSPTTTTSPSPTSPPARSSAATKSNPRRPTGATKTTSQAAGPTPQSETHDPRHLRPMSRDITSSGRQDSNLRPPGPQPEISPFLQLQTPVFTGF
jgi:transposase InsO family protein